MNLNGSNDNRLHWEACMDESRWYLFFGVSMGCLFGGIIFIVGFRLLKKCVNWIKETCASKLKRRETQVDAFRRPSTTSIKPSEPDTSSVETTAADMSIGGRISNFCTAITDIVHACAVYLVSHQTYVGRGFNALSMILSLCSFGIYVFEATVWPSEVEKCGHKERRFRLLDFLINIFFLFHFIIRWIAARDTLIFWIGGYSIVDYLTVPPVLLGYAINRTWLGFRFARVFRLTHLAEVLHNLNIIKSVSNLHLCHFITIFLSIWLSGAGMYQLLENSGNVFSSSIYQVSNPISYPNALYFTMITMSTVGYGDITPQSILGRIFICLFIFIALATFAGAIPVIEESFFSVRKYHGSYTKPAGMSHIVVCGDITTESVKTFLANFLHGDRRRTDVEVVFINPPLPDLQLQSILRLHFSRVKYYQGTVMDHNDMQRVRMDEADACLIVASSTSSDPDQKDAANIMRVIAVKNYAPHVRVIVQLLQTQNKAHLYNSPYWNWQAGDEILCFSELKLGFLAQSCVAMGFSTVLTNLLSMQSECELKQAERLYTASFEKKPEKTRHTSIAFARNSLRASQRTSNGISSPQNQKSTAFIGSMHTKSKTEIIRTSTEKHEKASSKRFEDKNWFHDYLYGMSMEIYSAKLSPSFEGLPFSKAAVICRQNLNILLIAMLANVCLRKRESATSSSDSEYEEQDCRMEEQEFLAINPTDASGIVVQKDTIGFFICDAQSNADRASFYCLRCHGSQRFLSPVQIKPCPCGMRQTTSFVKLQNYLSYNSRDELTATQDEMKELAVISGESDIERVVLRSGGNKLIQHQVKERCSVSSEQLKASGLDMTGMYHYGQFRTFKQGNLLHATTASWRSKHLYNHILVCLVTKEDSPLLGLHSFVMPLRASNIARHNLQKIVFVGSETFLQREWQNLSNFPDVHYLPGSPLIRSYLRTARIRCCSVCVVLGSAVHSRHEDRFLLDKEVILCSLNIRAMQFPRLHRNTKIPKVFHRKFGYEIPLITELVTDANIRYLDPDVMNPLAKRVPPSFTATFASGVSFTGSVLDVLASAAYFDGHAITVIRNLISGGVTPAMEQSFAEGCRLNPYETRIKDDTESENELRTRSIDRTIRRMHLQLGSLEVRQRPRLAQLSVLDSKLRSQMNNGFTTFGEMFCHAIEKHGILCLGLYRKRHIAKSELDMRITESAQLDQSAEKVTDHSVNNEFQFTKITNRYVITNPPNHYRLHRCDLVFCLCPFVAD